MKVTFLGTGTSQGVPIIGCNCSVCNSADPKDNRLRSSLLVETNNQVFVIDSGPDFRQQMLRAGVQKLDAILYTHGHKDHVAGLDDVRAFNYIQQKAMDIYAESNVFDTIKQEFSYVFEEDKYPGVPEVNVHIIDDQSFVVEGVTVVPIRCMHFKLPVLGFRIGNVAYLTDVNFIPEDQFEKLEGLEVLIVTALRKQKHISHFSLQEALELIDCVQPDKAYLTHISHQMGLTSEVARELPPNVYLAFDELTIDL